MNRIIFPLLCILSMFAILGCSSGEFPTNPGQSDFESTQSGFPVGISEFDSVGNPVAGYGALGLFDVHIDTETLSGEIYSLRSISSTDVLEIVDMTNFLMVTPCTNCVQLKSIELNSAGNLVVNIGIKHPFPAGNPQAPITGKNRGDLHVFNIESLIAAESGSSTSFAGIGKTVDNFRLLNADGYSAYLDSALDSNVFQTTANIHPYILHFADYSAGNFSASNPMGFASVTTPPPQGNLVMAMGCDMDYRDYIFDLSEGDIDFTLALGCTYSITTVGKNTRFAPEYRVPQHLKKAASGVSVRILANGLVGGDALSEAQIAIDVVDPNHGVAVGDALDQMAHDSSVSALTFEVNGVTNGLKSVTLTNTGGSGHSDSDPLTYLTTFQNEQSAGVGKYTGLVKVTDSYPIGVNSGSLSGYDGINRVAPLQNPSEGLFVISEFATYQTFTIEIGSSTNIPPTAILLPENPVIVEGQTIEFDASSSFDADGSIVTYEFMWDWDLNPANFMADISGTETIVTSDPYISEGTYYAGLKVIDNQFAVGFDSVEITVSNATYECPDAPFAGDPITQNFTYEDWYGFAFTASNWDYSGAIIDCDMLSTHFGICIYANPSTGIDGELRYFNPIGREAPGGNTQFTAVGDNYPGEQGASIDVDSDDLVVFVTLGSTYFAAAYPPNEFDWQDKIDATNDYFTVVDPFIGQTSEQIVTVGSTILAIDIDENDNVWVLDIDNVMHKYTKSSGYSEDLSRQFDLDIKSGGLFTGEVVYDFVINFHNEAFFILTDGSPEANLWRFECDGEYNALVSGNPNPLEGVLLQDTNGIADIAIDNLDDDGNILDGEQDSQIVVVGGYYVSGYDSLISRVDSNLNDPLQLLDSGFVDGFTNAFFDQVSNELWGWERSYWSSTWTEHWLAPAEWY